MSFFKTAKKSVIIILIFVVAILMFFYMKASKPTIPPAETKERVWVVQTQQLESGNYAPMTKLYGTVESSKNVTVSASVTGVLEKLSVQSGDYVSKGEPIFAINELDVSIPVSQAKSDVADFKTQIQLQKLSNKINVQRLEQEKQIFKIKKDNVARSERLLSRSLASQSALDNAKEAMVRQEYTLLGAQQAVEQNAQKLAQLNARLQKAEQAYTRAKLAAERANLVAPYDLRIASVMVSEGDLLTQNQPMLSHYSLESLELKAKVSVSKLPQVLSSFEQGYKVVAQLDWQGTTHELPLVRIDGQADASGVNAFFKVPESLTGIRVGTLLSVNLLEPVVTNSFLVPYSSLYGSDRIYLVRDGRLVNTPVKLHGQNILQGKTQAIVSGDIKSGDKVSITHLPNAIQDLKVMEPKS